MRRHDHLWITGKLLRFLHKAGQPAGAAVGLVLLSVSLPAGANSGNDLMRQGAKAYREGQLEEAVTAFREALDLAAEDDTLDPAAARLNLGTALARTGQFEPASAELAEALKTDDLPLQARAQYNLGHVRYREAEQLAEQQDLQNAKSKIDQSIGHFQDALRLDPSDLQTKKNFELSHLKKKEIETLIEQQPPQEQPSDDSQNQEQEDEDSQQDRQEDPNQQDNQDPQNQQDNQDSSQDSDEQDSSQPPQDSPPESEEEEEQDPSSQKNPPGAPPEEMTEEEAEMLLEAMKEEEQRNREQYRIRLGRPQPVDKDW